MSLNGGAFDPLRPGIVAVVRHPVLWALLIWSLAHLAANGDVGHVVLFGTFAAMSVLSMTPLDGRRRAKLGRAEWDRLAKRTPLLPALRAGWLAAGLFRQGHAACAPWAGDLWPIGNNACLVRWRAGIFVNWLRWNKEAAWRDC